MGRIFPTLLLLVVFTGFISGCTGVYPTNPDHATPASVSGEHLAATTLVIPVPTSMTGKWTLTGMKKSNGTALTRPTVEISLVISSNGSFYGNGGCNNYFGSLILAGQKISRGSEMKITRLGSTMKSCPDYFAQELDYILTLQKTDACEINGSKLVMTTPDGKLLEFQAAASLPTPAANPHPV